ncbi:MAG: NAD-dependent epimerase/dehydratase family protein [Pirellulales bacterium]
MSRVLVTGGSGFVGSHLVDALLREGRHVRCLLRATSSLKNLPADDIERVTGHLEDEESLARAVEDVDVVYHVGGVTRVLSMDEFERVNTRGTENLIRACLRRTTPPVFLLISSISAAGPAQLGSVRTEQDAPQPISIYGRSKRGGEEAAEAAAARLPVTILRPGIVFGPRDGELFTAIHSLAVSRFHVLPRRRTPPLSFIEASDLAQLMLVAAERGRRLAPPGASSPGTGSGFYFATGDEFPTYRQFGHMVARCLGRRFALPLVPPPPIPWTVAWMSEVIARARKRPIMLSRDKFREATVESWACSSQAAREQLGWAPSAPLQQQMSATIDWYRSVGWLKH